MESVSRLRDIVYDQLVDDPEVVAAGRFLAILKRTPKAGSGVTATPEAFYTAAESVLESGKLKPTISVLDGGDNPSPNGEAIGGSVGFPLVYGYVPNTPDGETLLAHLQRKLHHHFPRHGGKWYPLGTGPGVQMQTLERQLFRDGEEFGFAGRQFAIWRIQGTFVRP